MENEYSKVTYFFKSDLKLGEKKDITVKKKIDWIMFRESGAPRKRYNVPKIDFLTLLRCIKNSS